MLIYIVTQQNKKFRINFFDFLLLVLIALKKRTVKLGFSKQLGTDQICSLQPGLFL